MRRVILSMSIDKDSDGVPEVNLRRRTTKVNLVIIVAVSLFILCGVAAMWWMVNR
jgi:cell division protein FtsX